MILSRRTLFTTLAMMLPAVAADAAKRRKPVHKVTHVAKAATHGKPAVHHTAKAAPHGKPAAHQKVARRRHPAVKRVAKSG